ncbi:MAG: aminotransferase class III-fold pyridoxal phosphate-dependent enzyme [Oscillospiraceae bacterium]|nr:aminotransferase class III-fold pyridoxal phosphate-dependent enzyme [Oscillospiraceae bacterium]
MSLDEKTIQQYDVDCLLHSWSVQGKTPRPVIARAEGIYLYDTGGKRYYDMSSQAMNVNIGHGNQKVIQAVKDQMDNFASIGVGWATSVRSELAKKLLDISSDNMGKVFFTLGGAEANENALKIARMYTGRAKVFSRYRAYHGGTSGAGHLTGEPRRFPNEIAGSAGFIKFFDPYVYRDNLGFDSDAEASAYYLKALRQQIIFENPGNVAAVFVETVTGSNGIIIPPDGYLQGLRTLCDEFGILLVCDEVMAGFGRTGQYFAYQNWGIKPDLVTFAKGVTCGYLPVGGVIVDKKIADYFDDHVFSCGLTYTGYAAGCAAGVATLAVYEEENLIQAAVARGRLLGEILEDLKARHKSVGDVRYIGLFSALELVRDKQTREPLVPYGSDPDRLMPKINGALRAKGFCCATHNNNIIVAPPLIITEEELRAAMAILDEVLFTADQWV